MVLGLVWVGEKQFYEQFIKFNVLLYFWKWRNFVMKDYLYLSDINAQNDKINIFGQMGYQCYVFLCWNNPEITNLRWRFTALLSKVYISYFFSRLVSICSDCQITDKQSTELSHDKGIVFIKAEENVEWVPSF